MLQTFSTKDSGRTESVINMDQTCDELLHGFSGIFWQKTADVSLLALVGVQHEYVMSKIHESVRLGKCTTHGPAADPSDYRVPKGAEDVLGCCMLA